MGKYFLYITFLLLFQATIAQEAFTILFESGKFEANDIEKKKLKEWILNNKESKIVAINGYTDEDGSFGYNDTLAQKRVDFVFNQIKDKVKIREDFKTRSFGENFKQSKNKAENRKVVIYYILPEDLSREDEILGIKKEVVEEIPKPEIEYPEKIIFKNPNGTTSEISLDKEFMKRVEKSIPGEKLKLENLNFVVNTFAVVPESRGKLYELLLVLERNPNLKIVIQGHLCCQKVDRFDLSTQRAKAVYNFLLFNNIDKSRLGYKGFGSSQPIYPLPEKNEEERASNRRVEILIMEN